VTPPVLVIAEREFRAYVATLSFWIALLAGPLAIAGALGLAALASAPPAPITVVVAAPNLETRRSAAAALMEAARLEGRPILVSNSGDGAARLEVATSADEPARVGEVRFSGPIPLSAMGREFVVRTLERDELGRNLGLAQPPPPNVIAPPEAKPDAKAISRFALVMMLWLTLTGSLGMLLQAVVRERANRALEGLLAAVRPADIVFGKLAGVGAVSALVIGAWLGSAALLAGVATKGAGFGALVLGEFADPIPLARGGLIYVLAFAFYGLLTMALGSAARDTVQAQNLSRPMFAVLLAAFFAALASTAGASRALDWLVYLPPFAPFLLLLKAPGDLSAGSQVIALGLLTLAAVVCGRAALRGVELGSARVISRGSRQRAVGAN